MTNTENDSEMKEEAEERKFQWMAKVDDFLDMWQGTRNLHATQEKNCAQNDQMTAVHYISDREEIFKSPCSHFHHDGAAAFKSSERSPWSPALSPKDLAGGQTQILNVCRIPRINCPSVESDMDSVPDSVSNTDNWLNWNGNLDIPNDSEEGCTVDDESNVEHNNGIKNLEYPPQ